MKKNPIQFAVVREDPQIEMDIVNNFALERATLIGSGGCTAFCLKALKPEIEITLIEPNAAQTELIKTKSWILKGLHLPTMFGLENSSVKSLIECGNFESLFRQFRLFVQEFIVSEPEIEKSFQTNSPQIWEEVFAHPYWQVAFDLFFSDAMLVTMFGEAAIQHAPKNSYPAYFRRRLEKGLRRDDFHRNYFLHHIFLGRYLLKTNSLPFYLFHSIKNLDFEFFNDFAQNFEGFTGKQLAHFSNIFDWCDGGIVRQIAARAAEGLEKGSVVTFRQLNNRKDYRAFFGASFRWLETGEIVERDRSLFYEKIEIGEKIL
jgi:S-adenosylmethionine-diacylglycerol 3-amino-3-carboxypropyl transferase